MSGGTGATLALMGGGCVDTSAMQAAALARSWRLRSCCACRAADARSSCPTCCTNTAKSTFCCPAPGVPPPLCLREVDAGRDAPAPREGGALSGRGVGWETLSSPWPSALCSACSCPAAGAGRKALGMGVDVPSPACAVGDSVAGRGGGGRPGRPSTCHGMRWRSNMCRAVACWA